MNLERYMLHNMVDSRFPGYKKFHTVCEQEQHEEIECNQWDVDSNTPKNKHKNGICLIINDERFYQ